MHYRDNFELGIAEFNDQRFFECHDTFEFLWTEERGERKRFLQGLIQGAVGLFHAMRRNPSGAQSQLVKSIEKLNEFPPTYLGVDVASLRNGLTAFLGSVRENSAKGTADYDPMLIPKIIYVYDPDSMPDTEVG
jgi:predicted metal-dependent hydrolase